MARKRKTANEQVQDRTIRHAVYLEGLKDNQAREAYEHLETEVFRPARERVAKRFVDGAPPAHSARGRKFVEEVAKDAEKGARGMWALTSRFYADLTDEEIEWQIQVLREAVPVRWRFKTPSKTLREATVRLRPFQGKFLREWYRDAGEVIGQAYRSQISEGMRLGESTPRIMRRIRRIVEPRSRHELRTVTRTAIQHVANGARNETYKANDDIIKGWKFTATLDARTSDICQSLDGRVFKVGQGPYPPLHHQCRSTTTPVMKSWKELGINLKDAPPGTRASMNGQVPATVTYGQWLKSQPAAVQNKVLGPTRAKLMRAGKVRHDAFTDRLGNRLTLDELRKREGLTLKDVTVTTGKGAAGTAA